jgi:hypothetical protein
VGGLDPVGVIPEGKEDGIAVSVGAELYSRVMEKVLDFSVGMCRWSRLEQG